MAWALLMVNEQQANARCCCYNVELLLKSISADEGGGKREPHGQAIKERKQNPEIDILS